MSVVEESLRGRKVRTDRIPCRGAVFGVACCHVLGMPARRESGSFAFCCAENINAAEAVLLTKNVEAEGRRKGGAGISHLYSSICRFCRTGGNTMSSWNPAYDEKTDCYKAPQEPFRCNSAAITRAHWEEILYTI